MKKDGMLKGGILALLFLMSTTHADILHVPGDFPTIQAALVFALTGDTVLVGPGTYYEHIVWPTTQGIYLVSEYGADSTIIDAVGSLPVITIETDIDSTTVIQGFTIVNGNEDYGGGIYCAGASPTISHNTIMNNSATYGGGIFCYNGSPIISQNIITNNAPGGGITCWFSPSSKIVDNIIENNAGGEGGGISATVSCPEITGNAVNSNSAVVGGGMWFYKSTPVITYNIVSNNNAEYSGGLHFYQSDGNVNHNDIFGNGCGMCIEDQVLINAEYNWWGDSTGPYHPDSNPHGLGDTVSDYVDFDPWLLFPGVEEELITEPIEKHKNLCATILSGPLQLPRDKKCRVFDITGRAIEQSRITRGVYFVEVDGVVTQKVIKIR